MDNRIRVQEFPHSDCLFFSVNRLISQINKEKFYRPLRKSSEKYLQNVGDLGSRLVKAALRLPGVTEVEITPYMIEVTFSKAHDMESVKNSIIRLINREVYSGIDVSQIDIQTIKS